MSPPLPKTAAALVRPLLDWSCAVTVLNLRKTPAKILPKGGNGEERNDFLSPRLGSKAAYNFLRHLVWRKVIGGDFNLRSGLVGGFPLGQQLPDSLH